MINTRCFGWKGYEYMKSKLCWISFIPLTTAAVLIKGLQMFNIYFSADDTTASYLSIGAILLMFAINIIFIAIDKKTSPAYILRKNIPAAIFAILAAAMFTSKSALNLILSIQNNTYSFFTLMVSVFGFLTAVCLVIIALSHLQGRNFLPTMGAFFLSMPIWGGLVLIGEFLNNRTVSVYYVNPLKLFCYAFAMIFFFKLGMVIATVKGKNPVKSLFLYGMPLAAIGLVVGACNIVSIIQNGLDYSENVIAFGFMALGLYIISLLVEITKYALTKDEQILQYDLDDFDEEQRVYGAFQDNTVVAPEEQTGDYDYDYSYVKDEAENFVTAADDEYTEDYDYEYGYGEGEKSDAEDLVVAPEVEVEDDAIYVEKDKVETFEEQVLESNQETTDPNKEAEVSEEDQEKINKMIEDINS